MQIPKTVVRELGNYVYLLVDPRDEQIFYIGKGRGSRALAHLSDVQESNKLDLIRDIREQGLEPRVELLAHKLPDQETALRVEAAAIDLVGLGSLTNLVRGWKSRHTGRASLEELIATYRRRPIKIVEPSVLIRISQNYRYGMEPVELYDATRSAWRVGSNRDRIELAFAVHADVVREVYRVAHWLPAGSTLRADYPEGLPREEPRWEFVGRRAEESLRRRYADGYVGGFFKRGNQNPILYVNLD